MKYFFLKSNIKRENKNYYLSHIKNESFLFKTLPSFFSAYYANKNKTITSSIEKKNNFLKQLNKHESLTITWLGHASFLIRCGKLTIITDPVFGSLPFFSRINPCSIISEEIPNIDVVLLSHNHHDHMDRNSLAHIAYRNPKVIICIASGDKKWFNPSIFQSTEEFYWNDSIIFENDDQDTVKCIFLPAYHWSRRSIFDTNVSLWGSWIIQWRGKTIYFGADSAYFEHFKDIGLRYTIDIALLPIAPVSPREWMKRSHMDPDEAGKAFFDLNASTFVPMHWGTFNFGHESSDEPINLLRSWQYKNQNKLLQENKQLMILNVGVDFDVLI